MQRTIVVRLRPAPEQAEILRATLEQYTACFNEVAREGFTTGCKNGVELHHRTYALLRARYPALPAPLVCSARVKATEAVTSALTWNRRREQAHAEAVKRAALQGKAPPAFRPVRCPQSRLTSLRYDQRSYWVTWAEDGRGMCSLSTVAGRLLLPFRVLPHQAPFQSGKVCTADLCFRRGRWSLHIVVLLPDPVVTPSPEVIGVDVGLTHPAVTSSRRFLGEKRWKEQDRRIFRLRRALQAKGTRSAKRHLKRLRGKRFRLHRDHDHVLSKRLVEQAPAGSTLVLENLTHIRETSRLGRGPGKRTEAKRRLHSWSFAQLFSFIEYKAQAKGIRVVRIDPRHTSQTCSRCGFQHRGNRRTPAEFHCRACGYRLHADLNAAYTIRDRYLTCLAQEGTALLSGPTCQAASRVPSS
ncbi:MAG: transposase [Thermogemmatispora sp.]|uniref:RNA-guided endonuclease InsQ/TnpB family protein n=1 Tax=Thermogemmatispora sp. TaxID=1968838 RepID=UPI002620FFB9|nr:transposase [Thermogemmatispora sp.]MBX5459333.1 transposase [Thermogemmatispora sp.]